ncbi:hypothetical protein LX81_02672 [Palleronia aestuarii]|uniref:Transglycosylase-like protein with SLT domain n=2 Tax=Palleronia aestuarii TaxID=568105 RepID=A0A2W7N5T9_9RHOB|nr:hypothetical protein LX81_02672 [Palleronia aestuarii]
MLLAALLPQALAAAGEGYCARAALMAGEENGVPREVLMEVAGDSADPSPWRVTVDGRSQSFDARDTALGRAYHVFREGEESFAVGCFRVDFDLHGRHFASLDEMFDPLANARYAARFLALLHDDLGDWDKAVAAWRDRTGDYALALGPALETFREAPRAVSRGGAPGAGSLVPLGATGSSDER